MPEQPISAARFAITIDGYEVGRFETLLAATTPTAPPRALEVHELPLLLHVGEEPQSASSRSSRHIRWSDIVLKRGVCNQTSIERWQAFGASNVTLVGLGPTGQPIARWKLTSAQVTRHTFAREVPIKWPGATDILIASRLKLTAPNLNAKGGGDVAIEEIVIAYEGMGAY